jgi:hypothetical protein
MTKNKPQVIHSVSRTNKRTNEAMNDLRLEKQRQSVVSPRPNNIRKNERMERWLIWNFGISTSMTTTTRLDERNHFIAFVYSFVRSFVCLFHLVREHPWVRVISNHEICLLSLVVFVVFVVFVIFVIFVIATNRINGQ